MRIRARFVLFGLMAAFGLNPLLSTSSDAASDSFRSYAGETKERITEAAKTVLAASDPKGFEFTDSLNGFTGYRSYSEYAVVVYTTAKDKWVFETETKGKSVNAAVSVFSIGTRSGTFNSTAFEEPATSRPLMQLFWARVDYILGRAPNWPACPQSGSGNDLDPLCRSESGRSVSAPTPLPALAAAPRRQR